MAQYAEDTYPPFRGGFNTRTPATFTGGLSVVGNVSVSGSVTADNIGGGTTIIDDAGATRQLEASESGAVCLFNRAAGIIYTLPTPTKGLKFDFSTTVDLSSNAYKIITKAPASEFLAGYWQGYGTVAQGAALILCDQADPSSDVSLLFDLGSNHLKGYQGGTLHLVAISTTVWMVSGFSVIDSGANVANRPFKTS